MAELDITGRVNQRVHDRVSRLRKRMAVKVPLGPTREKLTVQELRVKIQNMDPVTKQRMMQTVGPEQWSAILDRLYG